LANTLLPMNVSAVVGSSASGAADRPTVIEVVAAECPVVVVVGDEHAVRVSADARVAKAAAIGTVTAPCLPGGNKESGIAFMMGRSV
jgi:hypothetical protein